MPTYEYVCPEGHMIEKRRPYADASKELLCPTHEEPCERVWNVPTTWVNKEYAKDIMNGWTKGEGKPMAGKTMAETQAIANAQAKAEKAPKMYAKVPNFTSFPGAPPRRNYTPD